MDNQTFFEFCPLILGILIINLIFKGIGHKITTPSQQPNRLFLQNQPSAKVKVAHQIKIHHLPPPLHLEVCHRLVLVRLLCHHLTIHQNLPPHHQTPPKAQLGVPPLL